MRPSDWSFVKLACYKEYVQLYACSHIVMHELASRILSERFRWLAAQLDNFPMPVPFISGMK